MHSSINVIAAIGLALGGAFGLAGAMVTQQNAQGILWAIDGAGLVMAASLLAIKYLRTGNDLVAGGFLVFAIGEGAILLSAPAAGFAGSIPAFAAGTALWGTSLLLVSIPKLFAVPISDPRHRERHPVFDHRGKHLLGRAAAADFGAAANLRLSPASRDLRRLDLDAVAGGRQQIDRSRGH